MKAQEVVKVFALGLIMCSFSLCLSRGALAAPIPEMVRCLEEAMDLFDDAVASVDGDHSVAKRVSKG